MATRRDFNKKVCILLLIKYPEKGRVKSRLAKAICGKIVVEIYRNSVLDILSVLARLNSSFMILFHPAAALRKFERWLGTKYEYIPQIGNNLGERLKNGFVDVFAKNYTNVIVLASDVPDLTKEVIREACEALDDSDVVIGPSPDGGYYLLGFTRSTFFPEVFEKIMWSKDTVFDDTLERLKKMKRRVHILPLWRDIDTLEDLKVFVEKNKKNTTSSSKTIKYLLEHKEILYKKTRSE